MGETDFLWERKERGLSVTKLTKKRNGLFVTKIREFSVGLLETYI